MKEAPITQAPEGAEDADDLVPFIPVATRGMLGLVEEQDVMDAAMAALSQSRCVALTLRLEDVHYLRIASASMGEAMMRAMATFIGGNAIDRRIDLDATTSLRRIIYKDLTTSGPVPQLCKELFPERAAGKVASLLGSVHSWSIGAPLHLGGKVIGALVVIQHRRHPADLAACAQLAESISTALAFGHVLEAVQRARVELSADHPAQHYLGAAMRTVGNLAPNAPRSLTPGGGIFETLRPRLRGDTFSILPDAFPASDPVPRPRARILLVEDEDRVRNSTIALLAGLGYEVEGTDSGERAIALYTTAKDQRAAFDLILMDQTLGGRMGGIETMRMLRSLDSEVRAVMLSGQATRESADELRKHGFLSTLAKPVALDELCVAIEDAIGFK